MATATFKKVAPKVSVSVTLELSEREAKMLQAIIGRINGNGVGKELHQIYYDLDKNGIKSTPFVVGMTGGDITVTETK